MGSGSALVLLAGRLNDPWRTIAGLAAVGVTYFVSWGWPLFSVWAKGRFIEWLNEREKRLAIKVLEKFVKRNKARLEDKDLTPESRLAIQKQIEDVEQTIIKKDFESVTYHMKA